MAKLNTTVHVDGVAYGPGEDVPADIVARISNPDVWDGPVPSGAGAAVVDQRTVGRVPVDATITPAQAVPTPARPAPVESNVPPRGGPGSGKDAWAAYADGKVEVTPEMTRDDIVAALDAAGVPTD